MFQKDREVGIKVSGEPFAFHKNTFVLVKDNVGLLGIDALLSYYTGRISHLGKLNENEYKRLMKCISNSIHLKRKVKRELERILSLK
jgi:hypothetical protein